MPITTLSSREFNQGASRAKKAAQKGPVFITDRGRPSHVLLSFDQYSKLSGPSRSIGDMLSDPAAAEIEFNPPRLGFIAREVDLN
jgi:prevent-host-death family protein